MNQRGQGFSVFKLLIAAIVAVFILTILLQILSGITPPTQGNPNQEASSKIKSLISALGTPERTGLVIFKKDTPFLNAKTIASQTGAIVEQYICLDVSEDFVDLDLFEGNEQLIRYTGNQDLQTKLLVICDSGDEIDISIGAAGMEDSFPTCEGYGSDSPTFCYVSIVATN